MVFVRSLCAFGSLNEEPHIYRHNLIETCLPKKHRIVNFAVTKRLIERLREQRLHFQVGIVCVCALIQLQMRLLFACNTYNECVWRDCVKRKAASLRVKVEVNTPHILIIQQKKSKPKHKYRKRTPTHTYKRPPPSPPSPNNVLERLRHDCTNRVALMAECVCECCSVAKTQRWPSLRICYRTQGCHKHIRNGFHFNLDASNHIFPQFADWRVEQHTREGIWHFALGFHMKCSWLARLAF